MQQVTSNIASNNVGAFAELFDYYAANKCFPPDSKVGMIFEGGALRGVMSWAYSAALAEFIDPHAFARLYGSSSGALNAVYFLSGMSDIALSIYVENATDKKCTNMLKFPNVLDVDWLIDTWIFGAKKFPVEKILGNPIPITITLTRLLDGKPGYFDSATATGHTLNQAMKATCYTPLLSNGSQTIDGVVYGDGAIADAIPYDRALADGCTHIICLLTRPRGYRKNRNGFLSGLFSRLRLSHHTRDYRAAFIHSEADYNALLDRLHGGKDLPVPTLVVSPADRTEVPGNIETRPEVIEKHGVAAFQGLKSQLANAFPVLKT